MTQLLGLMIAVALVVAFVYVLFRPHWAVVLIIVMFPLEQLVQSYVPALLFRPWVFNVSVGVVAVMAVLSRIAKGTPVFLGMRNRMLWLVVALFLLAIVGLIYTPAPEQAAEYLRVGLPYHVLMLLIMPLLIVDLRELNRVLVGTMVVGTVISILIFVNPQTTFYAGRLVMELGPKLSGGTYRGNALAVASMAGMIAMIAALIRFERATWLLNMLRVAAFVIGFGLAIRSGSRGQVGAAALTAVIFYPLARRVASPKQFLTVGIGAIALIAGTMLALKFFIGAENVARWDAQALASGAGERVIRLTTLLGAWLASPGHWLFGLGPNAFSALYPQDPSYVHNLLVEVLAEEGLVGLSLLMLILAVAYRSGRRLWKLSAEDPIPRATAALLLAICFYEVLLSMKQGTFIKNPAPFPWLLVLAKLAIVELAFATSWFRAAAAPDEAYEEDEELSGVLSPA